MTRTTSCTCDKRETVGQNRLFRPPEAFLTWLTRRGTSPAFAKELRGVTRVHQTDFPAQQPQAQTAPRVSRAHGGQERPQGAGEAPRQGPQASERLNPGRQTSAIQAGTTVTDRNPNPLPVERLRARREFLYVADGVSERRRLLVVQARRHPEPRPVAGAGFTATRKVGASVVRNRSRRRLREAARLLLPLLGRAGVDYVFIARQETGTAPWTGLLDDMETALLSLRRRFAAEGSPGPGAGNPLPAKV